MKKLSFVIALLIAIGNISVAQKGKKDAGTGIDVPAPVLKAFNAKYKMAKKTVWSQEEENYRADFKIGENSVSTSVAYSNDGKSLYIEKEMAKAQYNKAALKYISNEYPGYKVTTMRKHDTYDKKTSYITMLRKGREFLEVEFDKKGGFIRDTDKTPVVVSKKKPKKVDDEENTDEEKPAKSKVKAKKEKDEEKDEETKTEPEKEKKVKAPAKKTNEEDDEEEVKPESKKEKAKSAPKTKKKTTSDDEDEE